MPQVSVVIPFYNSAEYIRNTLLSVKNQSLSDIEIICVDDGSTDQSAEIIHKFKAKDNRIIYIKQENAGAGVARNNAIIHATGKYIAFMDSDDEYPERDTLELLFNKAEANNAMICGGSMWEKEITFSDSQRLEEGFVVFRNYQNIYWFQRYIFRRDFIINLHCLFPAYRVYEDPVFLVKAMNAAERFYYVPNATYKITCSHTSCKTCSLQQLQDYLCGILDVLSISIKNNYMNIFDSCLETLKGHFYSESFKCIRDGRADNEFFEKLTKLNSFFGQIEGMRIQNEYTYSKTGNIFQYRLGQISILITRIALKVFIKIPKLLYHSRKKTISIKSD